MVKVEGVNTQWLVASESKQKVRLEKSTITAEEEVARWERGGMWQTWLLRRLAVPVAGHALACPSY